MIRSMTGFGRAIVEFAGANLTVEVKTVNNRYLKASFRVPEALSPHETTFESDVRNALSRGSVNVTIRYGNARNGYRYTINEEVAKNYFESMKELSQKLGLEAPQSVRDVTTLPGVIEQQEELPFSDDEFLAAARKALGEALEACNAMREREGKALASDLEARCKSVIELNDQVRKRAPEVVDSYRQKLSDRVSRLLNGSGVELKEEDLVREVAYFADRCDISEENHRLEHHCTTTLELISKPGEAGRKLDFIAQEMLREANTIGSKANDASIASMVVSIKAEIEKFKEQVQNVE